MEVNYRRCVSCRTAAPKSFFWRIVRVFPDRTVQLDEGAGRSAYLCPQESCLRLAQKKKALGRSLRVAVSPEIYQTLWQRLNPSLSPAGSFQKDGADLVKSQEPSVQSEIL